MSFLQFWALIGLTILAALPDVSFAQSGASQFVAIGPMRIAPEPVKAPGILAYIPVTHSQRGIIKEAFAIDEFRVQEGTPVYAAVFGRAGTESVTAWCGEFESRVLLTWSKTLACVVQRPDGLANIVRADGLGRSPTSWFVTQLNARLASKSFPMPQIDPNEGIDIPLEMLLGVAELENGRAKISRILIDPAQTSAARTVFLSQVTLDLSTGPKLVDSLGGQIEVSVRQGGEVIARLVTPSQSPNPTIVDALSKAVPSIAPLAQRKKPTEFVVFGMYMSPVQMLARSGTITRGGILASGPARLWETGSLQTVVFKRTSNGAIVTADSGTDMQRVEVFSSRELGLRDTRVYWCGFFNFAAFGLNLKMPHCISKNAAGLDVLHTVTVRGKPAVIPANVVMQGDLVGSQVAVLAGTTSPAFDLVSDVVLKKVNRDSVDIAITAGRGQTRDEVLLMEVPLTEVGSARVPFWTHSLVLTRVGNGVTAQWEEETLGLGPVEAIVASQTRKE